MDLPFSSGTAIEMETGVSRNPDVPRHGDRQTDRSPEAQDAPRSKGSAAMTNEVAQSVTKNAAVMMGSQVVTWISTFILMLFLPRYLGSEEYGRLYLAISVGMIIQIVIEFGGNYYIPKEVSRDRESAPSLVMNFILIRILLWVVSILLLAGFANIASYPGEVKGLLLIIGTAKL